MNPWPWILASVAVFVVLWWNRRTPEAELPPLMPSPLGPPGGVPVASEQTSPFKIAASVLPWLVVGFLLLGRSTPAPVPAPTPAVGIDLLGKFTGEYGPSDAAITAELLASLADAIEFDGTHEKRLTTGAHLADLRAAAREYRTQGVSLGFRQPAARDEIKAYLDREVGTDGGPIDDASRAKWVAAFRSVSTAARAAIGR